MIFLTFSPDTNTFFIFFFSGMLEAEALKLSNQARFILEKCDGSLKIENKKKKVMIADLERKNFDPGAYPF